jgi:predicted O-methyltransferase YrrM
MPEDNKLLNPPGWLQSVIYGVPDYSKAGEIFQRFLDFPPQLRIFIADNLLTWGKNLSFLDCPDLMASVEKNAADNIDKAVLWRTAVLYWAAKRTLRLPGDWAECGCYRGYSARVLCEALKVNDHDKKFYLYDLFEHSEGMNHHHMPDHSAELVDKVKARFTDFPGVVVTKGSVPEVLADVSPESISFLHIDMNNAEAELGALEVLFDRVVPGGSIVFDDYGWSDYRPQKLAIDAFLAPRGYEVLELPTGQGLLIK